jgi:hypothetical protein
MSGTCMQHNNAPLRRSGGILLCPCRSVHRPHLVRSITKYRLDIQSSYLVRRLVMMSRWPLLIWRSVGQSSQWPWIQKVFVQPITRQLFDIQWYGGCVMTSSIPLLIFRSKVKVTVFDHKKSVRSITGQRFDRPSSNSVWKFVTTDRQLLFNTRSVCQRSRSH